MVGSVRSYAVVRHRHNIHLEIQVFLVEFDAVRWVVVVDMSSEKVFLLSLGSKKSEKIHNHCCENFQCNYFVFVVVITVIVDVIGGGGGGGGCLF